MQAKLLRVLERCFTDAEWAVLMEHKFFAQAMERLETLDDVESASMLGSKFLFDRDEKTKSIPRSIRVDGLEEKSESTKKRSSAVN